MKNLINFPPIPLFQNQPYVPEVMINAAGNLYVSPGEDGECIWWQTNNLKNKFTPIENKSVQALWLNQFKLEVTHDFLSWPEFLETMKVSQRTWEGWKIKNLPFYRFSSMLTLLKMKGYYQKHN